MDNHMRKPGKFNLTEGNIFQKLLMIAVPVMGTQLMQMSYNLTDMFWLGRVGSDAVAASGTAGMYMWLSAAFIMLGRMGAEIGVAQSLGRSDEDGARAYAQNALFLSILLGTLYGVFLIVFRRPLVGFFAIQEANVVADTETYLFIVSLAMPLSFITSATAGIFGAAGNSRTPFYVNAAGLVFNMILDPVLIIVFGWDVAGAAIATVVSQLFACFLMVLALKRGKTRPFEMIAFFARPQMIRIRQILRWSVPVGLESLFFTLLSMVTSRFTAAFGADAIAVSKVGSQIESLSWLIGGGYGSALTAFVGQNFGAGKWGRIKQGVSISIWAMLVWGIFITLLLFFAGGGIFSVFLPGEDMAAMGAVYLRILAFCQIPQCFEAIGGSAFKGMGRTTPPSVVSISANVIRVGLCYGLPMTGLGLNGIWLGITLASVLRGTWIFAWYLVSARKHPRMDIQDMAEYTV